MKKKYFLQCRQHRKPVIKKNPNPLDSAMEVIKKRNVRIAELELLLQQSDEENWLLNQALMDPEESREEDSLYNSHDDLPAYQDPKSEAVKQSNRLINLHVTNVPLGSQVVLLRSTGEFVTSGVSENGEISFPVPEGFYEIALYSTYFRANGSWYPKVEKPIKRALVRSRKAPFKLVSDTELSIYWYQDGSVTLLDGSWSRSSSRH